MIISHNAETLRELSIRFRNGWCYLTLHTEATNFTYKATTLRDAFGDLIEAVIHLAEGRNSAAVIWGGEGSGVFIDLAIVEQSKVSMVIHDMSDHNWVSSNNWAPIRGEVLTNIRCELAKFLGLFMAQIRLIQVTEVDVSSYMPQWGWSFPFFRSQYLERLAYPLGYKPRPTTEIKLSQKSQQNVTGGE